MKTNKLKFILSLALLAGFGASSQAQEEIHFDAYLDKVSQQNLEYMAACLNVDIADAEMIAAKSLPDPAVELELNKNTFNVELSYSIELAKKKARVQVAKSEKELEQLALENSFHDLRAQAAELFLDAILQKELLQVKTSSYEYMKELSRSDSLRLLSGDISEIDARQSRIECISLLNEVFEQEANYKSALVTLNQFMGVDSDTLLLPIGEWENLERDFCLPKLLEVGQLNRTEILMAAKNVEINEKAYKLTRAERRPDIDIALSYEQEWYSNEPEGRCMSLTLGIPLSFSAINKGALKSAQYQTKQSQLEAKDAEIQVRSEIRQAWNDFESACKKVAQYRSGIMEDSKKVLDGMVYKYKRGEASILDVLVSQRTYNEVCQDYLDTMKGYVSSLVTLERSCGFWDIHF